MAAVTAQLEQIRGEQAPEMPYDPSQVRIEQRRRAARTSTGGPRSTMGTAGTATAGRGAGHVSKPVKAAVFGTGSWGTAFGMVLADAGCEVTCCGRVAPNSRTRSTPPEPTRTTCPGSNSRETLRATADAAEAARDADFTVLAVPSQTLRGNLAEWAGLLAPDTVLVSLMKGVESAPPCG